ncbi:MAG: 50S ribosomal protein L9 [Acidobacteria bacterium]|nr:50S ribosomal protein L9 [Acidobacteriota bacterium]MDA1233237.1 50S ribosomal protein L9 [Acidobacteriota bacterium]
MRQEVILRKDVRKLGDRGQIVSVASGYARNYLYPQQLAMPANGANKKQIAEMRAAADKETDTLTNAASAIADKMKDLTVRAVARAGDSGVLFGSITARDIAALIVESGFEVDRHQVILGSPIKEVSDSEVTVHLYKDINVVVKVEVRAEGREDEPLVKEEPVQEEFFDEVAATPEGETEAAAEPADEASAAPEAEEED